MKAEDFLLTWSGWYSSSSPAPAPSSESLAVGVVFMEADSAKLSANSVVYFSVLSTMKFWNRNKLACKSWSYAKQVFMCFYLSICNSTWCCVIIFRINNSINLSKKLRGTKNQWGKIKKWMPSIKVKRGWHSKEIEMVLALPTQLSWIRIWSSPILYSGLED